MHNGAQGWSGSATPSDGHGESPGHGEPANEALRAEYGPRDERAPNGAGALPARRPKQRQSGPTQLRGRADSAATAAYIPPFAFICEALGITEAQMSEPRATVSVPFLRFLIGELMRAAPFDPAWYAHYYPDIEPALSGDEIASAHQHYLEQGYFEKRLPHSLAVDPDWYWRRYADLTRHYHRQEIAALCEHLFTQGWWEGRVGIPELSAHADRWVEAVRRYGAATGTAWHLEGRRTSPEQLLLRNFESLGWNCEFGLVQKWFGLEPMSLLAFGSLPPDRLLEALITDFDGLGDPENTGIELIDQEYFTVDKAHGYRNHTWYFHGQADEAQLFRRECRRLQFLKGKLLRDLAGERKILVYKKHPDWPDDAVAELRAVLRTRGDNVLLWVDVENSRHKSGEVQFLSDGFFKGYVDRFSSVDAAGSDISYEAWLRVCTALTRMLGRSDERAGLDAAVPVEAAD